jgi:hypothetical protein
MGTVTLEWIVRGHGDAAIEFRSIKGGTVSRSFRLP